MGLREIPGSAGGRNALTLSSTCHDSACYQLFAVQGLGEGNL